MITIAHLEALKSEKAQIAILQDWMYQSFLSRLFNISLTCRQVSSKEAKGPVSLCANIAGMCVPFQIVCNGYTKIFDFLNIFEDRSL